MLICKVNLHHLVKSKVLHELVVELYALELREEDKQDLGQFLWVLTW